MNRRTTVGRLLVNEALPEELRDENLVLNKKGMSDLLQRLAQEHPDKYVEVSKKLNDIGRTVATEFGGYTFGLEHLRTSAIAKKYRQEIQDKVQRILSTDTVGGKPVTPQMRKDMIVKTVIGYQQKQIDEIYEEAKKANNPLALQVVSGSRGNKMNLGSLLGSDLLYSDHRDDVIPLPVLSSYSQGLKPIEYWASTYGARRGTMATKFATQDAGFLSKQLNQVAHRLMVVDEDDARDLPNRGLPVDTDDSDNEGSLLAQDTGPYKRNTVLTPKLLKHLKSLGHDRLLVRSPLVGGSPDGGVYSRDVGVRERGVLPGRGEQVGLTAAQALSEPLSQGQLSAKHSGGVAGQEKAVGGFAYINQLIQAPKKFKGGATHSLHDGTVSAIEDAPAGGKYVWVGDKRHYVPEGVNLKVNKGDSVEAGDVLTEGFPIPGIVTELKGVGEGKRYFVNSFRRAMNDAGMKCNRRNVELLARGLINHVILTDEMGDHVPDDVIPYSTMEHIYEPREDHAVLHPSKAVGQYLEKPVLHYSIGTQIRPSVMKELQHFGVNEIAVHKDPPPFKPTMIRGMYSLQNDPDWMTRMYGSGLKESLLTATHRGAVSDEAGTSFVPSLSRAVDFGHIGAVRQPEAGIKLPAEGQPFADLPKLKLPSKPEIAPTVPEKPKKSGFFSGLFKSSAELEAEAYELLKVAAGTQVSSTITPNTGSSTGGEPPTTPVIRPPVAQQAPKPSSVIGNTGGLHMPTTPTQPINPSASQPQQPKVPEPPGSHTTPSLPGTVHPDRMMGSNPWRTGVGSPSSPFTFGVNPHALNEGYTPGAGMLGEHDDLDSAAQFVQGGGESNDPSSGFGGQFGAVTRFGSLFDTNAVATLTQGNQRLQNRDGGGYKDSLIGGDDSVPPMANGMPWSGLTGGQNQNAEPRSSIMPNASVPNAQVQQQQQNQPAFQPVPQGQTQNALKPYLAATVNNAGQQPGPNNFEDVKKEMAAVRNVDPSQISPADVHKQVAENTRFDMAARRAGFAPKQPKFEQLRQQIENEYKARVPDPVAERNILEQNLKLLEHTQPGSPEIAEYQNEIKMMDEYLKHGVPDGVVMEHIRQKKLVDPSSISDYMLHDEMSKANKSTSELLLDMTNPAVNALTTGAFRLAKGVGSSVPLLNKLPGLRPPPFTPQKFSVSLSVVAPQAERSLVRKALGAGYKGLTKAVSPLGWGMEAYNALNMTDEEALDRLKEKTEGSMSFSEAPLGHMWDNATNMGQNVRAIYSGLDDASKMQEQSAVQAQKNAVSEAAMLATRIQRMMQKGQLSPAEKSHLDASAARFVEIHTSSRNIPNFDKLLREKMEDPTGAIAEAKQKQDMAKFVQEQIKKTKTPSPFDTPVTPPVELSPAEKIKQQMQQMFQKRGSIGLRPPVGGIGGFNLTAALLKTLRRE